MKKIWNYCWILVVLSYAAFSYSEQKIAFNNSIFRLDGRARAFLPGELIIFEVRPLKGAEIASVNGAFLDTALEFYFEDGVYYALFGVPSKIRPGKYNAQVNARMSSGKEVSYSYQMKIYKRVFKVMRLKVDPFYIEYTPDILERIKREQEVLKAIWAKASETKLWNGLFIMPVESDVTQDFAVKRIFQGEFRSFHSGVDIHANWGTPVLAANRGTVVLTGDHFFSGNFIIIDHGRRVYSFYAHLEQVLVKQGDSVEKGQVIALSGNTGRATGPHLHWTMKVNSVNVNPLSLTSISLY